MKSRSLAKKRTKEIYLFLRYNVILCLKIQVYRGLLKIRDHKILLNYCSFYSVSFHVCFQHMLIQWHVAGYFSKNIYKLMVTLEYLSYCLFLKITI